jgi:hypothetical protein
MSVLSNGTASVRETENVFFYTLVRLNSIIGVLDDRTACRRSIIVRRLSVDNTVFQVHRC